MPETYGLPEPEPSKAEQAEPIIRNIISGHPQGAIRRTVLYLVLGITGLIATMVDGWIGLSAGAFALTAFLLLAMSDNYL
jgi:hypothetical protein